jgi:hypothetical protein
MAMESFCKSDLNSPMYRLSCVWFFLCSFQLLMLKAINIPITTSTISPVAYSRYLGIRFRESELKRNFLKNLIIGWLVDG